MLAFSKDKIISHYDKAKIIKEGRMPNPRMALMYPSYACGHSCAGCHYKDWNKDHSKSPFMDFTKFCETVHELELMGIEGIEFCGGGEPTVHPDFKEMVKFITLGKKMKFGLFTNAEGIDDETAEILSKEASYVRVSIDDEAEWDNIDRLVVAKKRNKSKCQIGAKILVNEVNLCDLDQKVRKADIYEVDYIQVKAEKPTKHPLKDKEGVMRYLILLEEHLDNNIKIHGNLYHTELKCDCWLTPIHTMIDVYGDVYLCCYYQFREESHKIGNCFNKSFKEVWHSERHKEAIKNIEPKSCNVFDCRFHHYSKHMKDFMENGHIEFI